jgi:hypothetical protein
MARGGDCVLMFKKAQSIINFEKQKRLTERILSKYGADICERCEHTGTCDITEKIEAELLSNNSLYS